MSFPATKAKIPKKCGKTSWKRRRWCLRDEDVKDTKDEERPQQIEGRRRCLRTQ